MAPSTLDQESHPTLSLNPHQKASRSLQSPSQRVSCCGPVALVEVPQSLPLVQHNRELCPRLPLRNRELYLSQKCRKPDPFPHRSLPCQMAWALTRVPRQPVHRARPLRLLRRRRRQLNQKSLGTRRCMTLQVRVLES